MEFLPLLKNSTPLLILGILIFLERIRGTMAAIREDIAELKDGVTWSDVCNARHEEINRRLERLEAGIANE